MVSNDGGHGSRAGQRGQKPCVSEIREGAIVGKEAVVNNDKKVTKRSNVKRTEHLPLGFHY